MERRPIRTKAKSTILSQLGVDDVKQANQVPTESDAKREAKQIELVDMMLRTKRRRLVQSLSSRLDYLIEERIGIAAYISDLSLSRAAGQVVSVATSIGERRAIEAQRSHPNPDGSPTDVVDKSQVQTKSSQVEINPTVKLPTSSSPTTKTTGQAQKQLHRITSRLPLQKPSPPTSSLRSTTPGLSVPKSASSSSSSPASHLHVQISARRPTEIPYEVLRKSKEFKTLSRKWTGLIVGIPVLIVTSWILYKDYAARMSERQTGVKPGSAVE